MTSLGASTAQSTIYDSPRTSDNKENNLVDSKPSCTVVNIKSAETSSSAEQKNDSVDRRERVLNKMSILQVDEKIVKMVDATRISICSDGQSICSEGRSICRICHGCGKEPLISPCRCSGSAQFVHASCLITWFKKSSRTMCELCHQNIKIEKKLRRLSQWESPKEKPFPILWCIAFHFSFILNVLAIVFHATERCVTSLCVMFYVLNTMGVIMNILYLTCWFPISVIYCRNWVALNEEWTFVETTDVSEEIDNDETSKKDLDDEKITTKL